MQVLQVVWAAWRSFVPHSQVKRLVTGRAEAHRRRHALQLCFAGWHDVAALLRWQRQHLAEALLRWDTRRLLLVWEGWRAVVAYKQRKQDKLTQVNGDDTRQGCRDAASP